MADANVIEIAGSPVTGVISKSDSEMVVRLEDGSISTIPIDHPIVGAIEAAAVPAAAPPVPAQVSPRQLRLALYQLGLLDQVDAAVSSADKPTQIAWEFSLQYERTHPMIATMAAAIGKSDADIDNLFRLAWTL